MTNFFGKAGEKRRDGEKLINWDIDTENISIEELRQTIKKTKNSFRIKPKRNPIKKLMKSVNATGTKTLTKALSAVLDEKAVDIPVAREFCDRVGLDPTITTVREVIIQCQLFYAFSGSAPHFLHLFDRVDGKIPNQTEVKLDGRAGISEAMAAMIGSTEQHEIEYEESDPEQMEMLAGTKNAEATVVEDESALDDELIRQNDAEFAEDDDLEEQDNV